MPRLPPVTPSSSRNAYAAPVADEVRDTGDGDGLDALVDSTKATTMVITSAGVVALTGTIQVLAAVQLWINFTLFDLFVIIPWVMVALGLSHFVVAAKIFRLRLWAARAGFALGIVGSLAAAAWLLLATASGLFTLYGVMLPLLGAATAVLSFLAIAPARAATQARRKLGSDGIDTEF